MKKLSTILAACAWAVTLNAQAPSSARLWKMAEQTLAGPAALQQGPFAIFWNPGRAGVPGSRLSAGIEVLETPDVIGITGVMAGAGLSVGPHAELGLALGRLEMGGLIRTTTSPNSEPGEIPLYDQLATLSLSLTNGSFTAGAALRAHDSKFDFEGEQGLTTDFGFTYTAFGRLTVGASTHFLSPTGDDREVSEYLVAAGLESFTATIGTDSLAVGFSYGLTLNRRDRIDHAFGASVGINESVLVRGLVTSEEGFGNRELRPAVEVLLMLGRYTIAIARGEGINSLGSNYRIGIDLALL